MRAGIQLGRHPSGAVDQSQVRQAPRAGVGGFAACSLALLLVAANVAAHLPELYGREYVLAPPAVKMALPPKPQSGDVLDQQRLDDALRDLENRDGPYGAGLSDPLTQLAAMHMKRGDAVEALRNYERALHLLRVNNGLLHPAQIPLLQALADVYRAIDDRRSSQLARRSVMRIHGMGTEALHDEALEDVLAYFQAARDTHIEPAVAADHGLFMQAYDDNKRLLKVQIDDPDEDYAALLAVGMSQLRNLYILMGTDVGPSIGDADPQAEYLMRMQSLAFGQGLDLLEVLLERLPQDFESLRAELLLARGNWQQWNGRWRSARADYAAAAAALDDSATAQALRQQMEAPAVLPEDPVLWQSLQQEGVPSHAVVRASYRVSLRGEASRIKVAVEGDGSSAFAGRIRRMLADSHFRPALVGGEPQVSEVDERRYLLLR